MIHPTRAFAVLALLGVGLSGAALAEASPGRDHAKGHRFEQADKNKDGFLTKDEVGERRWARISVADANRDNKVSRAELDKARAEGKLGHRRGPHGKGAGPAK